MERQFDDDEIIAALPHARGDDRTVLIGALGFSDGSSAVPMLRQLCASGPGHDRSAALVGLGSRAGEECTEYCLEALRSTSFNVQENAAMVLAEHGGPSAASGLFAWLDRKLGRKNRSILWSPYELPAAIGFAVRHEMHDDVAAIIVKHWDRLQPDERDWLGRTWPGLTGRVDRLAPGDHVPPPVQVQRDVYENERHLEAPSERTIELHKQCIERALRRAQKRAADSRTTRR